MSRYNLCLLILFIMINFSKEIESCLLSIRNTNNKEQNFQGRLYTHFLKYETMGYIVEMETNVKDDHISFFPKGIPYEKHEMDLLIYSADNKEKYAAELKWIYHQNDTGRWTFLDNLSDFEKDVRFVRQLHDELGFIETCSVVVYDTNPEKQTQLRPNRKNRIDEDKFIKQHVICNEPYIEKNLYDYFKYFIVTFNS